MSLSEAMTELADKMEKEKTEYLQLSPMHSYIVDNWISSIRSVIKASAGSENSSSPFPGYIPSNREMIEKAKEDMRKEKVKNTPQRVKEMLQEEESKMFAELVGGVEAFTDDGTPNYHQIDSETPVGAMIVIVDQIFQYRKDGKLHHMPEETEKYRNQMKTKKPEILLG